MGSLPWRRVPRAFLRTAFPIGPCAIFLLAMLPGAFVVAAFPGGRLISVSCETSQTPTQEPPPPSSGQSQPEPNPQAPPANANPGVYSSSNKNKRKYSHANDFLLLGTVFTPTGYAFPNVRLRLRRSSEKKFRWETYTNSRGEFAVRVPQGQEYEMVVQAKGFADQTRAVDARSGISQDTVTFQMQPVVGGKK
jgi:Carboxypeptidase regulatory-like domain